MIPQVKVGDVLLTSGVGGASANWRDRALSSAILKHQKRQMRGFVPTRSHAEFITGSGGETFGARWRTRRRPEGLRDYLHGDITIGRSPLMTPVLFHAAWKAARMDRFDGNIYPIHRLLLQAVGTWIFPWVTDIAAGRWLICSEVISKILHYAHHIVDGSAYAFVEGQWSGNTPAGLEREVRYGDDWLVIFDGVLTPLAYSRLVGESTSHQTERAGNG